MPDIQSWLLKSYGAGITKKDINYVALAGFDNGTFQVFINQELIFQ